ncbi:1-phosphofructokinase family hexose kinase [Mycobacterium sp. 155]|uniref:1-phosphofructokinase family hexose kinase n=1 Tax=Mycobacterium sp. 155 TaxID=1157943 RepID=UPI000372C284|nr:1-phosphofructokinase family hexose kinase [Mycobacterium sp. 155]
MIVTVTPNPSLDRTVTLANPLTRGAVQRVDTVTVEPGGKGINVARALILADVDVLAVLPAADDDPLLGALRTRGVPFTAVPIDEPVRTNLAITETDGTTTKLNERGAPLDEASLRALTDCVVQQAQSASWVVLSGSLPPGAPVDWYARVAAQLAPLDCLVAIDTSEAPLAALAAAFDVAAPDLIKPNAEELADLVGGSAEELEHAAAQGDQAPIVAAATQLIDRGVGAVLATLGAAGAILVNRVGAWHASPPPITPRSTVGAGDASLAGYLRATVDGAEPPQRLRMAVGYGSAAAALPGSALPTPAQLDLEPIRIHAMKVPL